MSRNRAPPFAWAGLLCVLMAAACMAVSDTPRTGAGFPVRPGIPSETIFVASNGWHSAIFVLRATIARGALPEIDDYPNAIYLGFGWGDAEYFPARDPGFMTLLSAALVPTPSVLHVTGLRIHPRDAYPKDTVIDLKISRAGFEALMAYVSDSFDRDGARRGKPVAPGLDPSSRFYRARGEFHLFNTCNSWTARGLATAGVPIETAGVVRADDLMEQVRALSEGKAAQSFE